MSDPDCGDPGNGYLWNGELDAVTGIPPRKAMDRILPALLRRMGQENLNLSALMIDIDHFKKFNDKWGHETGDRVLHHVCGIIRRSVRYRGEAFRYGGEEITVLYPNLPIEEAELSADRMRTLIYKSPLAPGRDKTQEIPLVVSVSIGVSEFPRVSGSELMVTADQALYQAKKQGRNMVVAYSSEGFKSTQNLMVLDVRFPAASSISEGSYVILARWFRRRGELTEIEALEISDPGRNLREIAEGRTPDGGPVTAEIRGRVTSVERRGSATFFTFEVEPEVVDLMYHHLEEKGL